jgi:membrane dipeptidase
LPPARRVPSIISIRQANTGRSANVEASLAPFNTDHGARSTEQEAKPTMLIVDGHLDLSMNALHWNRDLTRSVAETRRAEAGMTEKGRALGTVALPEMRVGEIGLCLATLIARVQRPGNPLPGYAAREIASAVAHGQLAYYRILERAGEVRLIETKAALDKHVNLWTRKDPERVSMGFLASAAHAPLGLILSMEGADPIVSPDDAADWWAKGLRVVGLTHYGVSSYAHGTDTEGGLLPGARPLLDAFAACGMVVDLTHLADQSFWEVLEAFPGRVCASHQNARALVPGVRQFSDEQIRAVINRAGILGAAFDAWMLQPGWIRGVTTNENLTMEAVADQIDHVCQLAGNARHAAIGTDLDGGYGKEQTPRDLDTIADVQQIPELLRRRGYSEEDVRAVMHGNWIRFFREAWTHS